jgi:phage tail-like protein
MLLPQKMGNVARAILDPLPGFNFTIALIDVSSPLRAVATIATAAVEATVTGGFTECSGLEMTMQPEEHKEGGSMTILRFPQRVTWTNVRLKRGVTVSDDLWNWYFAYLQGKGTRRDGIITLQNELHIPFKAWRFKRGIPVKWSGPSMNAGESRVAVEEIEIAHEGLELYAPSSGVAALTGGIGF